MSLIVPRDVGSRDSGYSSMQFSRSTSTEFAPSKTRAVGPSAAKTAIEESRFMALPSELRLLIYEHLIASENNLLLRKRSELEHFSPPANFCKLGPNNKIELCFHTPVLDMTSLLQVNKQIRKEAAPLFYSNHTFHHSINSVLPSGGFAELAQQHDNIQLQIHHISTKTFTHPHIAFMKYISLDYCSPYPFVGSAGIHQTLPSFHERVDFELRMCLSRLNEEALNLRTLRLSICILLRSSKSDSPGDSFLCGSFTMSPATKTTLRYLTSKLQKFEYVSFEYQPYPFYEFRSLLPRDEWTAEELNEWPGASIDARQDVEMQNLSTYGPTIQQLPWIPPQHASICQLTYLKRPGLVGGMGSGPAGGSCSDLKTECLPTMNHSRSESGLMMVRHTYCPVGGETLG